MLQLKNNCSFLYVLGLVCAFGALPNDAIAQGKDDPKFDAIQKQLKALNENLKSSFEAAAKDFRAFHEDLKALKANNTVMQLRINKAVDRIDQLEKSIGKSQVAKGPEKVKIPNGDVKKDEPKSGVDVKDVKGTGDAGILRVLKRIDDLEIQVASLEKELIKMKSQYKAFYPSELGLDEIKSRLKDLEKELSSLKGGAAHTAKSSPRFGRILLANSSAELMLFVVNNTTYRVNSMTSQSLDGVTPGPITYEVISSSDVRSSGRIVTNLKPGETLTLTASR